MNRKLLKLQLAGCGLLTAILAAEWGYGQFADQQLQTALQSSGQADYQADDLPQLNLPKHNSENFSAVVERPLFIEGRKPIAEAGPADTAQNAEVGQLEDWLLIGVYNKDKKPMALFGKQNEAKKYQKLAEQQSIAGWQVHQIQPDRVILQQGVQQKTVMLRKPRPQGKTPPTPKNRPAVPAKPAAPAVPPNNIPPENNNDDSQ